MTSSARNRYPVTESLRDTIEVRRLLPIDGDDFRELRLEALRLDGKYFASSYETENKRSQAEWDAQCVESREQCILGLFHEAELIGLTCISKWDGDPEGRTALFGSSYIKPAYRGLGLGALMYTKRLEWAKTSSSYDRAVVFHREGNEISRALNEQCGGGYWKSITMTWGDGEDIAGHWYEICLTSRGPENPVLFAKAKAA